MSKLIKRINVILLTLLILTSAVLTSCSGAGENPTSAETTAPTTQGDIQDAEEAVTEAAYVYPDEDFGGADFTVLNIEPVWNFYTQLDFENMTGDPLDDAIYNRNRFLEEKFNISFVEAIDTIDTIAAKIKTTVLAGDDIYDVTYCRGDQIGALVTEQYFYNLFDCPEINLDDPWWDQTIVKSGIIGNADALYFAASDLSLVGFYGTWILFFNEKICDNLGLDKPYQLVRDGEWTLDKLAEYVKAGANLNADESFAWSLDGSCVYGFTSFAAGMATLLAGTGERYIKQDSSGNPYFALDNERFYQAAEKIAKIAGTAGEYITSNDEDNNFHYELIFRDSRAFFTSAEIKASGRFRDMEDPYGILPNPKLNPEQEEYHNMMFMQSLLLSIPITQQDTHMAAVLMDAFSYQSYADVMPVFYDVTVSQKGLRNDDSIEMLDLIRHTRYYDIGLAYGWTNTLYETVRTALDTGKYDLASDLAAQTEPIAANIEKTMAVING